MKPITFNTEMTKAILDGRKVQFRRVINKVDIAHIAENKTVWAKFKDGRKCIYEMEDLILDFSKYQIGDILWVREPSRITHFLQTGSPSEGSYQEKIWLEYLADGTKKYIDVPERFYKTPKWIKKCQGIPNGCIKEMARIFLKITDVRVERLQDMTTEDFLDEGISDKGFVVKSPDNGLNEYYEYLKCKWINLWNSTAPKGYKWEDNPYVFVYEFERVEK